MSETFQFCVWLFLLGSLSCRVSATVMFDCENGYSIYKLFLCDGDDDCGDGSDERNCSHVSTTSATSLPENLEDGASRPGRLSITINGTFLNGFLRRLRNSVLVKFDCGNGQSVQNSYVCDGDDDCGNEADERNCSFRRFDCGNGRAVLNRVLCDGDDDCRNGADERSCTYVGWPEEDRSRPEGSSSRREGGIWIIRKSTENYFPLLFYCGNGNITRKSYLCDGDDDCGNGADERNCSLARFVCGNGRFLPGRVLCDGDDDCRDGTDERNCSHAKFDCGNGLSVPKSFLCDRDDDCVNGADERNCGLDSTSTTTATTTTASPEISVPPCLSLFLFDCGNGRFVRRTVVCNGNDDCGNQADERTCTRPSGFTPTQRQFTGNTSLNLKKEEVIKSPNYPADYPHNLNLLWNVTTAPGHRIKVVFSDFELEYSNTCTADFLKLYDGRDSSYPTLGTYCRHYGPQLAPVESSSNALIVHFQSDFSIAWRGFDLSLSTVCGGNLQAQTDENSLVSHTTFGEDIYGANVSCDWIIRSRNERNVHVTFSDFEVGMCVQHNEPQDYIEIFDGPDATGTRIGKYFGNRLPPTITSRAEEILLRFRSGHQGISRGFRATYKEV